jgi:hypothetical protein
MVVVDKVRVAVLKQGMECGASGVTFTYHQSVPDILESTTSASGDFSWKWLMMGKLALMVNDQMTMFEGGLMFGLDGKHFHAIALPESRTNEPLSFSGATQDLEVAPKFNKSFLGKTKFAGLKLTTDDQFAFGALVINELLRHGTTTPHGERSLLPALGVPAVA